MYQQKAEVYNQQVGDYNAWANAYNATRGNPTKSSTEMLNIVDQPTQYGGTNKVIVNSAGQQVGQYVSTENGMQPTWDPQYSHYAYPSQMGSGATLNADGTSFSYTTTTPWGNPGQPTAPTAPKDPTAGYSEGEVKKQLQEMPSYADQVRNANGKYSPFSGLLKSVMPFE